MSVWTIVDGELIARSSATYDGLLRPHLDRSSERSRKCQSWTPNLTVPNDNFSEEEEQPSDEEPAHLGESVVNYHKSTSHVELELVEKMEGKRFGEKSPVNLKQEALRGSDEHNSVESKSSGSIRQGKAKPIELKTRSMTSLKSISQGKF